MPRARPLERKDQHNETAHPHSDCYRLRSRLCFAARPCPGFDYSWDEKKGKELGLQEIWHDDRFTYLRGRFQETPALYEVKDKKLSLINFDFANGLYTVPKQLDNGYLTIGKQKVEFHRTAGSN